MRNDFDRILRRYGRLAAVHRGSESRIGAAMIQPILDRDSQWTPTPLGRKRQDRFLMLAGPELALDALGEDGYVEWDGQNYDVTAAHPVALGRQTLYWWAVLTAREDEA